jgi:hypothetical protein
MNFWMLYRLQLILYWRITYDSRYYSYSKLIVGVHHDEVTSVLTVKLVYGDRTHVGVPAELFQLMMSADSIGSFYARNIRNQFSSKPIEEQPNEF